VEHATLTVGKTTVDYFKWIGPVGRILAGDK